MRERSLVAFTLLAQAAVGLFWALAGVAWTSGASARAGLRGPFLAVGLLLAGAAAGSLLHLGTPRNAWRALTNLRRSWLSREILFLALFGLGWAALTAGMRTGVGGTSGAFGAGSAVVAALGAALVYSMSRVYRLRTVPAWDTALTPASFFLTTGSLGGLAAALASVLAGSGAAVPGPLALGASCLAAELALEPAWRAHRRRAAAQVDPSFHGGSAPPLLRPALLSLALALSIAAMGGAARGALVGSALGGALVAAVVGRADFYRSWARRGL